MSNLKLVFDLILPSRILSYEKIVSKRELVDKGTS